MKHHTSFQLWLVLLVTDEWTSALWGGLPSRHHRPARIDLPQQAIGYQKEIKKTLGKTSETDAYLKFEMTSYVNCQTDL